MKITALVENTSKSELKATHGLSLYIETACHKILFDLGPDGTLFENAAKRGVDLAAVDTVIISHGHYDHGQALARFLEVNQTAKIYIQRLAFEPYYTKIIFIKKSIGLDRSLMASSQIELLDGDYVIDDELSLFVVKDISVLRSDANDALLDKSGIDRFEHEQNLIIQEATGEGDIKRTIVMGCGHTGVVNILNRAQEFSRSCDAKADDGNIADSFTYCIGGYHLFNPVTKKVVSSALLDGIVAELQKYPNTSFYTCHCTGEKAYQYLAQRLSSMHYLSCGETIES